MSRFIKKCREEAGLTQAKLAEKMNVSVVAVQNWEKGKNGISPDKYIDLAAIFNVSVEKLIKEMVIEEDKSRPDRWPEFLFDEYINDIVNTLHLNLAQQDLFGLLYIYGSEYLQKKVIDIDDFEEDLKRIPYDFIARIGSIRFMNQAEDLHKVVKHVKSDFLLKILKQNPDTEFNLRKLSKNQICEFIDHGYKTADDSTCFDTGYEGEEELQFRISMRKARIILPVLEKVGPVHLADECWSAPIREDIPEELQSAILEMCGFHQELWEEGYYKKEYTVVNIMSGLREVTEYNNISPKGEKECWMWGINEKGKKLLKWFRE